MKLTYLSNILSPYQKDLSDELYDRLGNDFKFIATENLDDERRNLKWKEPNEPYLINTVDGYDVDSYINNADVVVYGSAPYSMIKKRKRDNKIIIGYAERILKRGEGFFDFWPRFLKYNIIYSNKKNMYLLCTSAFTSYDFEKFGLLQGKRFKWGYFPKCRIYDDIDELIDCKEDNSLLWVGRYISWKHPEAAVKVAKELKEKGYSFRLYFVGDGDAVIKGHLEKMVKENNLYENILFCGSMPPDVVRKKMEQSEIFLFTSDRNEGWGVVLNEAMNSGCCPVASDMPGSVPWLIEDDENGYVYQDGDVDMLVSKVEYLFSHKEKRVAMAKEAYRTILEMWNPSVAADRLIALSQDLLEGKECMGKFNNGICSKADIIVV